MPTITVTGATKFYTRPARQRAMPSAHAKGVIIGRLYTGQPQHHIDTQAGTYWEVLPRVQGHAAALQKGLLK